MHRLAVAVIAAALLAGGPAQAQQAPKPPAVGVVAVARQPITPSSEYVGRIQATERVNVVARVSAFLDQRFFTEGAEVKKGDLLYRLEQGPFLADVQAKEAAVAQYKAQLQNAVVTLDRAKALLHSPAGQQSTVDAALANERALEAQVQGAEAQLEQSQINLGYTEIHAPIEGTIGRTAVTPGNYVSTASGTLATIVSQDPIYVVFPVAARTVIDLRGRAAGKPGLGVVIKIRLPDGRIYGETGTLDFVDNTVAANTDTITLRGVLRNPPLSGGGAGGTGRELVDGELVTVILQEAQPVEALMVPRSAVLSDLGGDYVYVVDPENRAHQRRIKLGPSTPTEAVVASGLNEGESVIVDGIQRVRPGEPVSPSPAASQAGPGGPDALPPHRS